MQTMTQFQSTVQLLASFGVLIGLLAVPVIIFKMRQYFPDKDDTVSKVELEKRMHEWTLERQAAVAEQFALLRTDMQSTITQLGLGSMKQMDQVLETMRDIKETSKEGFQKASEAKDLALGAKHQAELASRDILALDRLVMGKLSSIEILLTETLAKRREA